METAIQPGNLYLARSGDTRYTVIPFLDPPHVARGRVRVKVERRMNDGSWRQSNITTFRASHIAQQVDFGNWTQQNV